MPNDACVKFYCPNCGYVLIWRCEAAGNLLDRTNVLVADLRGHK